LPHANKTGATKSGSDDEVRKIATNRDLWDKAYDSPSGNNQGLVLKYEQVLLSSITESADKVEANLGNVVAYSKV
jgi:hypothetical protein